jgi:iron complex transport system substrate-binding protein
MCAGAAEARIVTDMLGRAVAVPGRPLRVVSLAPSLTETVFALGRGDWLVGVTDVCNYPEAAARKPRIGGLGAPDLERIVWARPDLVLLSAEGNSRDTLRQLDRLGVAAFAVTPSSVAGVVLAIEGVADVLGAQERGAALRDAIRERVGLTGSRLAGAARARTLFLIWTDPLIAAGRGTFLDDLIGLAGGINAAGGGPAPYPRLGWEAMIAAAPEVVLVASHRGVSEAVPEPALAAAWQRWRAVPAIRSGRIASVPGDLVLRPGPRVADALEQLARAIHPAAFGGRP